MTDDLTALERRTLQQRLVAGLGVRALEGESLEDLRDAIARGAAEGLSSQFGSVFSLNEEQAALILVASVGWPAELVAEGVEAPLAGPSPAAETVRSGRALVIEDVPSHPTASQSRLLTMHRIVSSATAPVQSRQRLHGVLAVHSQERRAFTSEDVFFLRALAQLLAAAADRLEIEQANRALFSGAGEAMLLIDARGRCLDANPAAEQLFGRSREELLDASPADLVPPEQAAESEARVARLAQGETLSGSSVIRRPDGERRQVEWNMRANLLPRRHLAILRDVTERRTLEEQLARAQRLESVGQLAAGVAHDFNNLLTAIIGYADFADHMTDNEQLHAQLAGVRTAARDGASLTRQLLAIGRSRVVRAVPTDLRALIHETETLLRRALAEDIELAIRADTELVALVDPAEIQQVILNLALNARDAMPEGGTLRLSAESIRLDVEHANTHLEIEPGDYAVISVDDTGTGMDEETRQRAFEPFFTTKHEQQGSGLGLSTIYGIVRQAGGTIWLYSEPGLGTTIKVYLPRVDQAPTKLVQAVRRERAPVAAGNQTILLVEDNDLLRELLSTMLGEAGYTVHAATAPEQALELFAGHTDEIAALLSDIVMPGMRGSELARRLRARRPDLPIVFMSGYAGETIDLSDFEHDTHFLEKPFTADALQHALATALSTEPTPETMGA